MPPPRNKRPPPPGYEIIEPIIEALENELRDKVKESNEGKRNTESIWPVHQINWQRTRYVYDMFYTYGKISRKVYDYCLKNKIADAALIAKWKKPGYERLCSTYVINTANYKFGTTSICRVPMKDRNEAQKTAQDPTTGCLGCASGKGAGPRNIFGNKYGQNLAAVYIAREQRMKDIERKRELEEEKRREQEMMEEEQEKAEAAAEAAKSKEDAGESETDDDSSDDEDYGPSPAAGVWAGSQKLEAKSLAIAEGETEDSEGNGENDSRPNKKIRITE